MGNIYFIQYIYIADPPSPQEQGEMVIGQSNWPRRSNTVSGIDTRRLRVATLYVHVWRPGVLSRDSTQSNFKVFPLRRSVKC